MRKTPHGPRPGILPNPAIWRNGYAVKLIGARLPISERRKLRQQGKARLARGGHVAARQCLGVICGGRL
jgi:hypothetical protein